MAITQRAEKWIADSGDDTEELREAAEIMAGLVAEIEKCKQSTIKLEYREIEQKAAEFFDWPTNNRDFVTSTSAILFAVSMIQAYCHSDEAVEARCKELEKELERERTSTLGSFTYQQAKASGRREGMEEACDIVDDVVQDHRWGNDGSCGINTAIKDALRKAAQEVTT